MQFAPESIGSKLIETITTGLYDGNLNCLREYVQNGVDSGAKNIKIYFEGRNNLLIRDDGSGMDADELKMALSIGVSKKSDISVGWRGIGIWSGVPACKKITIITKKRNNNKYRIEINNDILRKGSLDDKPFLTVFQEATGDIDELPLGNDESLKNDHFTEIRLESILVTQQTIFSKKKIHNYLSKTVPAPLDESKFLLAEEVDKWLGGKKVTISDVNIFFENEKIYRYPDRSDIFFKDVIKREFLVRDKLVAVGWFISSNENRVIPAPNGGIFFKKKGFTIGDADLIEKLNITENYSRWQYGEIHIVSKDFRENSARNNFEYNNPYIEDFLKNVGTFISELQNSNRYQSDKIQTKLVITAREAIESNDFVFAKRSLHKALERMSRSRKYPSDKALRRLKNVIDDIAKQNIQDIINIDQELKSKDPNYKEDLSNYIKKSIESLDKYVDQGSIETLSEDTEEKENAIEDSSDESIEEPLTQPKETENELPGKDTTPIDKDAKQARILPEKNEPLMDVLKRNFSPAIKASLARSTKQGLEYLEMSATDPIKQILMEKTGLSKNEMFKLSKEAYGWGDVTTEKKPHKLILFRDVKIRNSRFGAMIYTIHDLIVNIAKHESGGDDFKWFMTATKEEKMTLIAEIYAMIDFIYRLIEKSEKNK